MYIFCLKVRFFNELLMAKNEGILTVVSLKLTTWRTSGARRKKSVRVSCAFGLKTLLEKNKI